MKTKFYILLFLFFVSKSFSQNSNIFGIVIDKESKTPLAGVNIEFDDRGVTTNDLGEFFLDSTLGKTATFSYVGYDSAKIIFSDNMIVALSQKPIPFNAINVIATRAIDKVSPISFSNLTSEEISLRYTTEDIPMILSSEPGIWAYSESGNGTGYSYISIRGFDQSRIAVYLDGVPLNDNESHQVYWVDHGDLLSDAENVQIQRGIGNNLFGSSAFGGSINVDTKISSEKREISGTIGSGDWNTQKVSASYRSGKDLGDDLSLALRLSNITSDGYREFHNSHQKGLFFALEKRGKIKNQFRALIGYENTDLLWDGIFMDDINNREKRRLGYKSYTDDFLQQIYSLNTSYALSEDIFIRNTSYIVNGKGYYETEKTGQAFYNYNLDINDQYTDEQEKNILTDFLRRKWIDNQYYGMIPSITWTSNELRIDIGGELRFYKGDHYGEITDFSNTSLSESINGWFQYYNYTGKKNINSAFLNLLWHPKDQPFTIMANFQNQNINWELDQKRIGRAVGYQLDANWNFSNPRFGMMWEIGDSLNAFINWGTAQKEPADNQIIEADDMFNKPKLAAAEVITDIELGLDFDLPRGRVKLNGYRIQYLNEQLKNIDVNQEGEYDYYFADSTEHSGFEWEAYFIYNAKINLSANGSYMLNLFNNGNFIPNIPATLFNFSLNYDFSKDLQLFTHLKRVGRMFVDNSNNQAGAIDPYSLIDIGALYNFNNFEILLKANNILDTLYSTYGYGYEYNGYQAYFWPGATRNFYIGLTYNFK